MRVVKRFVCYAFRHGWDNISCGVSVNVRLPNIEIHLPVVFLRIGWVETWPDARCINADQIRKLCHGYGCEF